MKPNPYSTIILALALVSPIGCVDGEDDLQQRSATQDPFSLTYSQDELVASLEFDDSFVLVRFRKGEPRPRDFRRDPTIDSPHIFDTALQDRNGALLHLQMGGDMLIDPHWIDLMVPPPETSTLDERHEDILLTLDLLDQLESRPGPGREFFWEIKSLRTALETTLREVSFSGPQNLNAEPSLPPVGTAQTEQEALLPPPSQLTTYTHEVQIRSGPCCWNWGEHSAVLVRVYDDSSQSFLTSIETGNHGRQPLHPSMSTAAFCPKAWSGRLNFAPVVQPYILTDTAWDGDAGGCNTPYGITSLKHVCNDDSLAQFLNVKNNSAASNWLTCGDGMLRAAAPHCGF